MKEIWQIDIKKFFYFLRWYENAILVLSFEKQSSEFPVSAVVKTLHFHYKGHRFSPWSGN